MKFEKINYVNGKKGILIGFVIAFVLVIVINLFFTRAKYKLVESRKLANGTINYTLVDFELAGIKFKANGSQTYEDVDTIQDNYVFNENESYCTEKYTNESNSFEDVKSTSLTINFDKENKTISVKPYSKKGTKCYLFFDEEKIITSEDVLNDLGLTSNGSAKFTGTSCDGGCTLRENGVYEAEDDFGISYYYRGTIDNNWLVFGKDTTNNQYIWWRIIRINGNGTIRLIYAGTSKDTKKAPSATGETTMITPRQNIGGSSYPRAVYFNQSYNDNTYVGYMTGGIGKSKYEETHTNASNSTVLDEIVNWYTNNTNLGTLANGYIDVDTGFCGDRQVDKTADQSAPGDGYGNQYTGYAPWGRIYTNGWKKTQTPTLKCGYNGSSTDKTAQERDLYTGPSANTSGTKGSNGEMVKGNNKLPVPVGLITSDEVVFAGGFGGTSNHGYWLYTNRYYWTMSPYSFYGAFAYVFLVNNDGDLTSNYVPNEITGVRPVINLKAGTKFTLDEKGDPGTGTNPYVVQTL